MIAEKMSREVQKIRAVLLREDGDIYHIGPKMLDALENEIERLKDFEQTALLPGAQGDEHAA
ncbi:MAG: hypothetical protein RR014_00950, partial [Bilophila sp.]